MKSHSTAAMAVRIYCVVVGLAGVALLAAMLPQATLPPLVDAAALFIASACVKNLGFHIVSGVTHSLVGIIDLAALFLFGGPSAGLLAGLAAAVTQWQITGRDRDYTMPVRLVESWYVGGLRALILVAVGALYRAVGGEIPLGILEWKGFLPVLVASCALFMLDHLAWWLGITLKHGWDGGLAFLRQISTYSLFVELAPLPAAVVFAEIYYTQSGPAVVVMLLALLAAGLVLRRLVASRDMERRRVRELSLMSGLAQDLLKAGPEPGAIYHLLHRYTSELVPSRGFAVQRPDQEGRPDLVYAMVDGAPTTPLDAGEGSYSVVAKAREPLYLSDANAASLTPLDLGFPCRSGFYLPVEAGGELLAVISLQHDRPGSFVHDREELLVAAASQAGQALRAARAYRRERERAAHLMAVAEVGRKVAAILDLEILFRDTVRLVQETFGYHCVSVFTTERESEDVTFRASSNPVIQERGVTIAWGEGIVGWVAAHGEATVSSEVEQDVRFSRDALLPETRSEVAVPLRVEDRILGVLDVQSERANAFSQDDLVALGALSDLVAIAIEDSRLYQEGQEQAWVSTALLQVAESVAQSNTREEILDSVVRLAEMLTGVDRCLVYLWVEQQDSFELVEASGVSPEELQVLRSRPIAAAEVPILAHARESGERTRGRATEIEAVLGLSSGHAQSDGGLVALPLRAGGEVVGVLVAEELDGRGLAWKHRETILAGAADYAGMALENARLTASLREEAWASAALLQVATMISASPDLEEMLTTVVHLTPLLVSVGWCAILLWDDQEERFRLVRSQATPAEIEAVLRSQASASGQAVFLRLMEADEPFESTIGVAGQDGSDGAQRVTAFPLRTWDHLLGGFVIGGVTSRQRAPEHRTGILAGIANQLTLAIESARLQQQALEQERLQRSIELAREIQESFLPECCPEPEGWDLAAEWRAARGVGGDFYDFITLSDDRLGLVIADVSDKGVGAALYMALSRAVLRAAALTTADPAETLRRANRVLMDDARSGMFVTVFYAVVSLATGEMTYARAGHNPALLLQAGSGEIIELRPGGIVLGILEDPQLETGSLMLEPGDLLLLYTDGIVEAVNERQQEFGYERLLETLRTCDDASAERALRRIDEAVQAFVGDEPQADDITLIVMRRALSH